MKELLALLIFSVPLFAYAECKHALADIKPLVIKIFSPIYESYPLFINQSEFVEVSKQIKPLIKELLVCYEEIEEHERKNLHFSKWGEKSDIYFRHMSHIQAVDMQIDALISSYDSIWQRLLIDKKMWKKVLDDYLAKEI